MEAVDDVEEIVEDDPGDDDHAASGCGGEERGRYPV